jgi:hypothetical protein
MGRVLLSSSTLFGLCSRRETGAVTFVKHKDLHNHCWDQDGRPTLGDMLDIKWKNTLVMGRVLLSSSSLLGVSSCGVRGARD